MTFSDRRFRDRFVSLLVADREELPHVEVRPGRATTLPSPQGFDPGTPGHSVRRLAITRIIKNRTGWSIKKFVAKARRYRIITIAVGEQTLTAAYPLPGDLQVAITASRELSRVRHIQVGLLCANTRSMNHHNSRRTTITDRVGSICLIDMYLVHERQHQIALGDDDGTPK